MISAVAETSEASIEEIKFHYYFFQSCEILKRMESLAKSAFSSFCSIRGKFFRQTPLQSPENSKNFLFLVLLSEIIIPEVIRV